MEVTIISTETIKPSVPLHHLKPYKLCRFDQLAPANYPSIVLFYPIKDPIFNLPKTLAHLKKSLSETLTLYYPFSGITKNNLYIDDFDTGIPYLEARVNFTMSDFLKLKEMELLNKFLLFHPFSKETPGPQIAFQVSVFACGGIALGTSVCHKLSDGSSMSNFLMSWAAIFSGSYDKVIQPNLSQAASVFPPLTEIPENLLNVVNQLFFKDNNFVTKRFIFQTEAIAVLKATAKSKGTPKPTRNEVVSSFIWKHAIVASRAISGTHRTSMVGHTMNMRPRIKALSLENCTGNLLWYGIVETNPAHNKEIELKELVGLTKEVLSGFNNDFFETMKGEDGFEVVSELLDLMGKIMSLESERPDIYIFTNWKNFFHGIDFGWGKPVWIGYDGKVGDACRYNLIVLVDVQEGKGIEAFVTLEDKQMAVLEKDPNFLAFASDPSTAADHYNSRL